LNILIFTIRALQASFYSITMVRNTVTMRATICLDKQLMFVDKLCLFLTSPHTCLCMVIIILYRYSPQHPLVVMDTARTGYGCNRSTDHHGDGSLSVSVHLRPSCTVVGSPSLAFPGLPPLAVVDWLVGLCTATLVPVDRKTDVLYLN